MRSRDLVSRRFPPWLMCKGWKVGPGYPNCGSRKRDRAGATTEYALSCVNHRCGKEGAPRRNNEAGSLGIATPIAHHLENTRFPTGWTCVSGLGDVGWLACLHLGADLKVRGVPMGRRTIVAPMHGVPFCANVWLHQSPLCVAGIALGGMPDWPKLHHSFFTTPLQIATMLFLLVMESLLPIYLLILARLSHRTRMGLPTLYQPNIHILYEAVTSHYWRSFGLWSLLVLGNILDSSHYKASHELFYASIVITAELYFNDYNYLAVYNY
jgi:hypothetical protein